MKTGWHVTYRFEGAHTWQELDALIRNESGDTDNLGCACDEEYQQLVKEGWIKFDGKETTVWADGEYEE